MAAASYNSVGNREWGYNRRAHRAGSAWWALWPPIRPAGQGDSGGVVDYCRVKLVTGDSTATESFPFADLTTDSPPRTVSLPNAGFSPKPAHAK